MKPPMKSKKRQTNGNTIMKTVQNIIVMVEIISGVEDKKRCYYIQKSFSE